MATPDRWAPWIEARAPLSGVASVSSTSFADLPGCSITFTPHINCRLSVPWTVDALLSAAPGVSVLIVRLLVNGVAQGEQALFNPATLNGRGSVQQEIAIDLTKETTYTLKLQAAVSVGGSTYSLGANHTGLGPIVAMPKLHG